MERMLVGSRVEPEHRQEPPAPPQETINHDPSVVTARIRDRAPRARLSQLQSFESADFPQAMFSVTPADMARTHKVYSRAEYNVDTGEAQYYYADRLPDPDIDARTLGDDLNGPNPRLRPTQGYAHDEVKPLRTEVRAEIPQPDGGAGPGGAIPLQVEQYSALIAQQLALKHRDVALNQNGERPPHVRDDQRPAGFNGYVNQIRVAPALASQQRGDAVNERQPTGSGASYNPNPMADHARQADRRVDNGHDSTTRPDYRAPQQAAVDGPTSTNWYRDNPGTTHRAETEVRPRMDGLGELPGRGPGPMIPEDFDPGRSRRSLGEIAPIRRGPPTSQIKAVATAMTSMMQWAGRGGNRMQLPTAVAAGMAPQQSGTIAPTTAWQTIPHQVRARRSGMPGVAQAFPTQQVPGAHIGGTAHQGKDSLRPQRRSMLGDFTRHTAPGAQVGSLPPTLTTRRGPVGEGSLGVAARGLAQTTQQTVRPAALPQSELTDTHRARLAAAFEALRTGDTGRQGPLAVGQAPTSRRDGPVRRVADNIAAALGSRSRGQRAAPLRHADPVENYRQDPRRADTATTAGMEPAAVPSVAVPAPINYQPASLPNRGEMTENRPTVLTTGRGGPGTVGAASITPALTARFRSDQ